MLMISPPPFFFGGRIGGSGDNSNRALLPKMSSFAASTWQYQPHHVTVESVELCSRPL